MTELLPCPFCGGEAELLTFWDFYKFSCKNADCQAHVADAPYVQHAEGVWYGSIDEARAAWNTRAERTCKMNLVKMFPEYEDCAFECWECSACKRTNDEQRPRFCPNCGVKVVGE